MLFFTHNIPVCFKVIKWPPRALVLCRGEKMPERSTKRSWSFEAQRTSAYHSIGRVSVHRKDCPHFRVVSSRNSSGRTPRDDHEDGCQVGTVVSVGATGAGTSESAAKVDDIAERVERSLFDARTAAVRSIQSRPSLWCRKLRIEFISSRRCASSKTPIPSPLSTMAYPDLGRRRDTQKSCL